MPPTLVILALITAAISVLSIVYSPRAKTTASFYKGHDASGMAPGVLTLTLSQVTTWIFARSIMNAAILGYFYGIAGALAYAAYYLSFITGAQIIASLRFKHGFGSVQDFLYDRFGLAGTTSYNFVVGVRLLSEVFANLLVIGLIFGTDGTLAYSASIVLVGCATLGYALLGGLNASIRTDAIQMSLFIIVLAGLMLVALGSGSFDVPAMMTTSPDAASPGWVLLVVALLQVWSYPLHDPVMMDRGFIADRKKTMASFYHAAWISILCIMAFGLLGVWAGMNKLEGESFVPTLSRLIGEWPMLFFNIALIVSCMSTLDSTFSSTSKLAIVDMRLGAPTVENGRCGHGCLFNRRPDDGFPRFKGSVRRGGSLRHSLDVPGPRRVLLTLDGPDGYPGLELPDSLLHRDGGRYSLLHGVVGLFEPDRFDDWA
jgi:Na+/proline symporter